MSENGLSYGKYLRIPELLQQQQVKSDPEAHDELQFIIVHQVYELWFKLVLHEMDEVQRLIIDGRDASLHSAMRLTRRIVEILKVLTSQIHVLETMRPSDFLRFRSLLKPASGFQSVQFREFEATLGLKDQTLASYTSEEPGFDKLERRMAQASLADTFYEALQKKGFTVAVPRRERTEEERDITIRSLKTIYDAPDEYPLLYDLCEAIVEVDEQVVLWRRHHVMMVERWAVRH